MTDFRALCAELADTLECVLDSPDPHCLALIARARTALAQPEPVLPPNYIDAEHTGQDQELLKVFYKACLSEGGTADEITLRGLKAVLAKPEPVVPTASDVTELFYRHIGEGSEVGFENAIVEALARWRQPVGATDEELRQLEEMLWDRYKTLGFQGEEFMYEHSFGFALADFARWGQP